MTMDDFIMDMNARAFAAFAESNPRLNELAEKDSDKLLTEAEEAEFFALLNKAEEEFDDDLLMPDDDDPIWEEDNIDLFGPWWE